MYPPQGQSPSNPIPPPTSPPTTLSLEQEHFRNQFCKVLKNGKILLLEKATETNHYNENVLY